MLYMPLGSAKDWKFLQLSVTWEDPWVLIQVLAGMKGIDRGDGGGPGSGSPWAAVLGTSGLSQMVHAPAQTCSRSRKMKRLLGPPWTRGLNCGEHAKRPRARGWALGPWEPPAPSLGDKEGRENGVSSELPPALIWWNQRH